MGTVPKRAQKRKSASSTVQHALSAAENSLSSSSGSPGGAGALSTADSSVQANVSDAAAPLQIEKALRESESRFRAVVESSSDIIIIFDLGGTIVYESPSMTRLLGYEPEELLGSNGFDYVHPEDVGLARQSFEYGLINPAEFPVIEVRLCHKDGSWRPFEAVSNVLRDRDTPAGVVASLRYLGDRKNAEQALRKSEERYRQLFKKNLAGVFLSRLDGEILDCNHSFAQMLGYGNPDEVLQLRASDLYFAEADRQNFIQELLKRRSVSNYEIRLRCRDGSEMWALENVALIGEGRSAIVQGTLVDISDRKRSEELQSALYRISDCSNAAEDLQQLYGAVHQIIGELISADNIYIAVVDSSREWLHFPYFVDQREAHVTRRLRRGLTEYVLRTGEPLLADAAIIQALKDSGEIEKDIGATCVDWLGVPLKSGQTIFGAIALQSYDQRIRYRQRDKDILTFVSQHIANAIDRKRKEEALRESEARYRSLVQSAVYGIYRSTVDDRFVDVNPALVSMLGYDSAEELLKVSLAKNIYVDPEERQRLIAESDKNEPLQNVDVHWKRKDGRLITVRVSGRRLVLGDGKPIFEMIAEDITERRALEEQLRQSQKMEAIGRLAGGVAHDFNNLLTVIKGYSELMLEELETADPLRAEIDEIKKAADRAATLTRQLLAFSRQQVLAPKVLDLNSVIQNMDRLLRRLVGEDIQLAAILEATIGRTKADPGQIEQVIMNLAVNARDAMPKGGKLTIETMNVDLDENYTREHVAVKPGPYVMIAVSDNGTGMSDKVRVRIFEPFFTTKEAGKGTGLGLSTVYGIVKQSGGYVWVYSELGIGTTFKVYLPRVDAPIDSSPLKGDSGQPRPRGTETILLVEDEDGVRALVRQLLHKYGYNVLECRHGGEALLLCERHQGPIDLLLTDVVLEQMSGRELAERLSDLRPAMRVLYVSGYTDDAAVQHGVLRSGTAFLQKPFTTEALARKVRQVLDSATPDTPEPKNMRRRNRRP
jgi:PAS domain S-box-containing protein